MADGWKDGGEFLDGGWKRWFGGGWSATKQAGTFMEGASSAFLALAVAQKSRLDTINNQTLQFVIASAVSTCTGSMLCKVACLKSLYVYNSHQVQHLF